MRSVFDYDDEDDDDRKGGGRREAVYCHDAVTVTPPEGSLRFSRQIITDCHDKFSATQPYLVKKNRTKKTDKPIHRRSTLCKLILRSVIPIVYIRTTVDQRSRNSSQKHNYICMYNSVPNTCFGRFLTGHHQVGYNFGGTIYLLKYSHW